MSVRIEKGVTPPIYIVAESHVRAEQFAWDHKIPKRKYHYVCEPNRLQGLRGATVIVLGYPRNTDLTEWDHAIHWARYKPPNKTKETKMKVFFNRIFNFFKGIQCPKCGNRWNRNHSYATKTTKVVYVCGDCDHVFGAPKKGFRPWM